MNPGSKDILFAEERKQKILELLKQNTKLFVPELCKIFDVSSATIRNDLRELSNAGLIQRTHGGALLLEQASYELDTSQKEIKNVNEKKALAQFAASLINDGDSIALDTGTTTMELAKQICQKNGLTIVLNDIEIARFLEDNSTANIVLAGGMLRRKFHCLIGNMAVRDLQSFQVDKAFMATNGISAKNGLSTPDMNVAEIKKTIMEISHEVIVITDSSKLGGISFARFAPITKINRLIMDSKGDPKELVAIRESGVEVNLVEV